MENKQETQPQADPEDPKIFFYKFTEEHKAEAEQIISDDTESLSPRTFDKFENGARRFWDIFFLKNKANFYKDRHYISREFGLEEKIAVLKPKKNRRMNYLEIGCAVGNTMFPLRELFSEDLYIFGFDFSNNAINCIRQDERYDTKDIYAFVGDLVKIKFPLKIDLAAGVEKFDDKKVEDDGEELKETEIMLPKMDFISLIFVLSAINPTHYEDCLTKIYDHMESDSYFYFRDYGRYDLAMIRFAKRKDAKLSENFYLKSDGTRCYYFEEGELKALLEKTGWVVEGIKTDYREVKNRGKGLTMNRVWV